MSPYRRDVSILFEEDPAAEARRLFGTPESRFTREVTAIVLSACAIMFAAVSMTSPDGLIRDIASVWPIAWWATCFVLLAKNGVEALARRFGR